MPMLEVSRLSVQFGQKKIVDGLSFTVEEGQWLMIVGPNGAGKSTALNAVTQGVPYTGRVLFAGQDVAKMKPALRAQAIGVLAQNHFIGYGFTVEEVVRLGRFAYAGGLLGRSQTEDREKVEQALTLAGLQDKRRQSVLTLSGGELQRVLLALALEPIPNILILDEPLSGVDVEGMNALMDMLDEIRKTYDLSILMTTHDFSMLPRYADQVALIDHTVVCKGTPQEVLSSEAFRRTFHMQGGSL